MRRREVQAGSPCEILPDWSGLSGLGRECDMAAKVDLYDSAYGNYELDVYRQVRIETYGEDLGQTSWVTTEESNEIPQLLELTPESRVLEIGCGLGRYALRLAETIGCRI